MTAVNQTSTLKAYLYSLNNISALAVTQQQCQEHDILLLNGEVQ